MLAYLKGDYSAALKLAEEGSHLETEVCRNLAFFVISSKYYLFWSCSGYRYPLLFMNTRFSRFRVSLTGFESDLTFLNDIILHACWCLLRLASHGNFRSLLCCDADTAWKKACGERRDACSCVESRDGFLKLLVPPHPSKPLYLSPRSCTHCCVPRQHDHGDCIIYTSCKVVGGGFELCWSEAGGSDLIYFL